MIYKKIEIKSGADLPKQSGEYWASYNNNDIELFYYDSTIDMWTKGIYLCEQIYWYLQPTEIKFPGELEKVNAERTYPMKKYPYTNIPELMINADKINTAGEGFRDGIIWVINWIKENNK